MILDVIGEQLALFELAKQVAHEDSLSRGQLALYNGYIRLSSAVVAKVVLDFSGHFVYKAVEAYC